MEKNEGGRAFPRQQVVGDHPYGSDHNHPKVVAHEGMSLRDYFAAAALPELIKMASTIRYNHEPGNGVNDRNEMPWSPSAAKAAYQIADDMLAEREK